MTNLVPRTIRGPIGSDNLGWQAGIRGTVGRDNKIRERIDGSGKNNC